jgi:hypothetical protein
VNCSSCGRPVPVDAGFCRNCGAILRGRAASATVIPSFPQTGPSPPASGPEPPAPPLAEAGYFGPPLEPGWHGQRYESSTKSATTSRQSGKYSAANDERMRRHMLAFDYGIIAASGLVLLSTTITWYQARIVVVGGRETLTRHLLSANAGIQRWLVPIVAALIITEVVLNMLWLRSSHREWKLHRGIAMLLCVVDLGLVVGCLASSPFGGVNLANLGLQFDLGPGAWLALSGAIAGILAAFARMFAGRPALTRSAVAPSRNHPFGEQGG